MVSILRTVLVTTGPMEGVESSGLLGGPQFGSEVTLVWQCLQIQAARGGGPGSFQPRLEATVASGNWTSRPRWWGDLVMTVCLSR